MMVVVLIGLQMKRRFSQNKKKLKDTYIHFYDQSHRNNKTWHCSSYKSLALKDNSLCSCILSIFLIYADDIFCIDNHTRISCIQYHFTYTSIQASLWDMSHPSCRARRYSWSGYKYTTLHHTVKLNALNRPNTAWWCSSSRFFFGDDDLRQLQIQ